MNNFHYNQNWLSPTSAQQLRSKTNLLKSSCYCAKFQSDSSTHTNDPTNLLRLKIDEILKNSILTSGRKRKSNSSNLEIFANKNMKFSHDNNSHNCKRKSLHSSKVNNSNKVNNDFTEQHDSNNNVKSLLTGMNNSSKVIATSTSISTNHTIKCSECRSRTVDDRERIILATRLNQTGLLKDVEEPQTRNIYEEVRQQSPKVPIEEEDELFEDDLNDEEKYEVETRLKKNRLNNKIKREKNMILNFLSNLVNCAIDSVTIANDRNEKKDVKSKDFLIQQNMKNLLEILSLNDRFLWRLADQLASKWKNIGRNLNIPEKEINIIKTNYLDKDGERECLYQLLIIWRDNTDQYSNTSDLVHTYADEFINDFLQYSQQNNKANIITVRSGIIKWCYLLQSIAHSNQDIDNIDLIELL
ncbi:hypothetical protein SNEBB_003895 [Seison nebaliae]|nr:hypothetical protein SNEBB_003895 [Seison nebaliae]